MSIDPKIIDEVLELIPTERKEDFKRKADIYVEQGYPGLCRLIDAVNDELKDMSSKIGDYRTCYIERPHSKKPEVKKLEKKWQD